jgi:hypothetical protein
MASKRPKLTYNVDLPGGARKRLAEAILYVSAVCQDDPAFGMTRLNKTLFEADFLSYALRGKPITGVRYQRIRNGPAPKSMLPRLNELQAGGDLVIQPADFLGRPQNRPIAMRTADLGVFSGEDVAILDRVIRESWGKRATEVSAESHRIEWWTRQDGDDIPYEACWLSNAPVSPAEVSRTQALAAEYGW